MPFSSFFQLFMTTDINPVCIEYESKYIFLFCQMLEEIPAIVWYFVFSDDLDWCRENLELENSIFVDLPDWKSLWLMTLCDSFVISASTLSWWGAYLSLKENKTTYAPDVWLTNGLNTDDVYHSEHTKIPCYVMNGVLYAKP